MTMVSAYCAAAQSLPELLRSTLAQDPAYAAAQAQLRAAEQRLVQARGGYLPNAALSYSVSDTRYDQDKPTSELRKFHAEQNNLQVTQPLIRPVVLAAIEQAKDLQKQAEAQLQVAQTDVMVRLIEAYRDMLLASDNLVLLGAQKAATAEQLISARRSFEVGTVSITDVREAEAKADTVGAELAAAELDFQLKQQLVSEMVGAPIQQVSRQLNKDGLPHLELNELADWLQAALDQNAQIRQAQHALEAARSETKKARYGHAPTVDLTYSYGTSSNTGTAANAFAQGGTSGQIGINVNLPLFSGFATQAKVEESLALEDKARSDVDAARRGETVAVRKSFSAALSSIRRAAGLQTAEHSAEAAWKANKRGYEVGMRVNADVLDALSKWFETRRDLAQARYDSWVNFFKLKASAGRLSEADFAQLEASFIPADGQVHAGTVATNEALSDAFVQTLSTRYGLVKAAPSLPETTENHTSVAESAQ